MKEIRKIEDFSQPELDVYARMKEAQLLHLYEPDGGVFIAESPKVIARALDAGCQPISILMEDTKPNPETAELLARCGDIVVYTASSEVLKQLTGFALTRGLLCAMHRPKLPSVEEICTKDVRRIAVLENVVNPTNVGAIFRSAAALQMDAVLLTPGCSDPLYRRAIRVSMGTVFQIPWTILEKDCVWPAQGMKRLHEMGFYTVAMALRDDSLSIADERLKAEEKLALILGTEGDGLLDETIKACDATVKIPMAHGVDSLNVAAASAVAFWQVTQG